MERAVFGGWDDDRDDLNLSDPIVVLSRILKEQNNSSKAI